jgi:hypothetical protein
MAITHSGMCLLRPARKGEAEGPGSRFFRLLRQIIESAPSRASSTWNATADTPRPASSPAFSRASWS